MKQKIKWLIPLALLAMMILSFHLSARLTALCRSTSLRYEVPLTARQVQWARSYAEENGTTYPTFWTESDTWVSDGERSVPAVQILYNGDPDLPYPVTYRHGNAPGLTENACAISVGLAWELWKADRVVGMTLVIDGTEYTLSGVFEEDACRLIRMGEEGFTAVELMDIPSNEDSYRYALDLAAQSGLGLPSGVLWGHGMAALARLLPFLPLFLAACSLAAPFLGKLKRLPAVFWGILALVFALAMPTLLEIIPGWLVPTRWSDFGFYSRLFATFRDRWQALLLLCPTPMDAERKGLLLGVLFACGGCCALTVEFKHTFFPKQQV